MTNPSFPSCSPPHGNIGSFDFHYQTYEMASKWYYGRLAIFKKSSILGRGSICIFSKIRHYIFQKHIISIFVSSRHKTMLGAFPSVPAGAFFSVGNRPNIFRTHNIAIIGGRGQQKWSKVTEVKNWGLGIHPSAAAAAPEWVSSSAARTLPSTRAGGQDDVSYNKLPQTKGNPEFHTHENS